MMLRKRLRFKGRMRQSESYPHFVLRFRDMAGRSVNKVILVGHLGRDAETRYTPAGVAVSQFTLATNRRWKDSQSGEWKDETDWHRIVLWRNENLVQYLTKGKQVYIEGSLRTRSWDDKDGQKRSTTEVVVDDIILLSGQGGGGRAEGGYPEESQESRPRGPVSAPRQQAQRPSAAPPSAPASAPAADDFGPGITDDDVPF
jgi:single-strand DNA-binding protein